MADLTQVNSSYQTGTVDTATTLVDNTDDMLARHVNGPNSAIIQIETILGDGPTLKGSTASLAGRLDIALASTGKLNDFSATTKTTFPPTVAEGCTGAVTLTSNGVLLGNGTSAISATAAGSAGQVLRVPTAGGTPAFAHLIPAGTVMLFFQASAPSGWTQVTTQNDKALRVVSGTGAGTGGSTAFTSVFGSGKTTGSYTLTTSDVPAHTHDMGNHTHTGPSHTHDMGNHTHLEIYGDNGGAGGSNEFSSTGGTNAGAGSTTTTTVRNTAGPSTNTTSASGTGASGTPSTNTTSSSGGGGGHTHTLSLDLQYADVLLASKD